VFGFRTLALYTGANGNPVGARFRHAATGFEFDYLQIESVPQAFVWVNSPATSDKGEPHTQEHLLLGKGNKGRAVGTAEALTMSASSAYTMPWRTCYFFNTTAGADAFYDQLQMRLDALLHPDYTDEEVRREVRNFGVTAGPDGSLRLEEKGSVYNEMVSTMDKSGSQLFRALRTAVYGPNHPLAFEAGGTPEALRTLTPDEIRTFHQANYRLGNMGMVGSFPASLPLASVLQRVGAILSSLEPGTRAAAAAAVSSSSVPAFPPPAPAPGGALQIVSFPDRSAEQPGEVALAWPAERQLSPEDYLLMSLFFDNLASDADTPLYKRFIDAKTRALDTGAKGVYAWTPNDPGFPVFVGLSDVRPATLNEQGVAAIRKAVMDEVAKIAAWPDGSPELLAFNAKLRTRIVAYRRSQAKLVNSPPGFGERFTSSAWMELGLLLERTPGFRKSVLLTPQLDALDRRLTGKANPWRTLLRQWKILGVTPYAAAAKADPALLAQQEKERAERIAAEVARLKTVYGAADDAEAIRRYKADYDAETARQEAIAAAQEATGARFLDKPPLTLDDPLQFRQTTLAGGVPLFAATFDTMTSATVRLSLRLDGVAGDDLVYLAALPTLLDSVGVVEKGKPLRYEETLQRQRREILSLSASFNTNPAAGRYELALTGAGNDATEARRAVAWMQTTLTAPNWREDNLPRLRDVVDQELAALRNAMLGQEEFWTGAVRTSWRDQAQPLALTTGSFLTRAHQLQRLRWRLKAAPTPADGKAFLAFLPLLGHAAQDAPTADRRAALSALLAALKKGAAAPSAELPAELRPVAAAHGALPAAAKTLAADAADDLAANLGDLPDETLARDWEALCREFARDFSVEPREALRRLEALRARLLTTGRARVALVGSTTLQKQLTAPLDGLVGTLTKAPAPPRVAPVAGPGIVTARLRERAPSADPVFVGLLAPSMKGGVVMNETPSASYADTSDESLLRLLAASLYAGGGADSVFMKTWGAGLAYGNGIGLDLARGRVSYYADHTPTLPQTVGFVAETVRAAPSKPALVEYAFANIIRSRAARGFEARAFAMADDLADGVTPAVVRNFRTRLLALRDRPDLVSAVYDRLPPVMRGLLPGYEAGDEATTTPPAGAHYVVIGPEKQLDAYEHYLKQHLGPQTTLFRLYPRDFWLTGPPAQ
jgi:Predicted Zn-dependent peptidases, insulinase-like